jgi:hypothetical protein
VRTRDAGAAGPSGVSRRHDGGHARVTAGGSAEGADQGGEGEATTKSLCKKLYHKNVELEKENRLLRVQLGGGASSRHIRVWVVSLAMAVATRGARLRTACRASPGLTRTRACSGGRGRGRRRAREHGRSGGHASGAHGEPAARPAERRAESLRSPGAHADGEATRCALLRGSSLWLGSTPYPLHHHRFRDTGSRVGCRIDGHRGARSRPSCPARPGPSESPSGSIRCLMAAAN